MNRRSLLGGLAGIFSARVAPAGFSSAIAGGVLMPVRSLAPTLRFQLVNQPVSVVREWIRISRELSRDEPAFVAAMNKRIRYEFIR